MRTAPAASAVRRPPCALLSLYRGTTSSPSSRNYRQRFAVVRAAAASDDAAAASGAAPSSSSSSAPPPPPTLADMLRTRGINTVAVAGATGGVGSAVVRALLAASAAPSSSPPTLRVRALARSESRAAQSLPPFGANSQLSVAVSDVRQFATLPAALKGVDALVIATGPPRTLNPLDVVDVDYTGNLNLVAAAQQAGTVKHIVFVSTIGADDLVNALNLFWGVCFWKKQAEGAIQRSGIPYTVIRPGGLRDSGSAGGVVLGGPGTWGVPPLRQAGSILRSQVADLAVEALAAPDLSAGRVIEAIAKDDQPARPIAQLFAEL